MSSEIGRLLVGENGYAAHRNACLTLNHSQALYFYHASQIFTSVWSSILQGFVFVARAIRSEMTSISGTTHNRRLFWLISEAMSISDDNPPMPICPLVNKYGIFYADVTARNEHVSLRCWRIDSEVILSRSMAADKMASNVLYHLHQMGDNTREAFA